MNIISNKPIYSRTDLSEKEAYTFVREIWARNYRKMPYFEAQRQYDRIYSEGECNINGINLKIDGIR